MGDRRVDAIFNSTQNYNPYSNISITESTFPAEHTLTIEGRAIVQGRDILKELDEMRDAMLLLKRDIDLEAKYPELKQAYDDYMELYRGLQFAEKFYQTGNENG